MGEYKTDNTSIANRNEHWEKCHTFVDVCIITYKILFVNIKCIKIIFESISMNIVITTATKEKYLLS